jgi:hypothetical protein
MVVNSSTSRCCAAIASRAASAWLDRRQDLYAVRYTENGKKFEV